MRAYVFWHVPAARQHRTDYERELCLYHKLLSEDPPQGFVGSLTFQLARIPWLGNEAGYEDWYLLEDLAALQRLESHAVSGRLKAPHQAIAAHCSLGTGGLYCLSHGEQADLDGPSSLWFDKPAGVSYASMHSTLEARGEELAGRLWQRSLCLGPTPEFCLFRSGPDFLPYGWKGILSIRRPVRPG